MDGRAERGERLDHRCDWVVCGNDHLNVYAAGVQVSGEVGIRDGFVYRFQVEKRFHQGVNALFARVRTDALDLLVARALVRTPSRGGIDSYHPVLDCIASWLDAHGLGYRRLAGPGGTTVALGCEVTGAAAGPRYVLDACLDTAPFGDESAWRQSPTSAVIADGWLRGRGSSDSKTGAAIFAHILARLKSARDRWAGSVALLLDVDEHTGAFGGARAFFEAPGAPPVDGVMIGYPGLDHVVTGGRGVLRARLHVHGVAGHSGSAAQPAVLADDDELAADALR